MRIEKTRGFRAGPPRDEQGRVVDGSWYHRRWLAYRRTPGYWFRRVYFGWRIWIVVMLACRVASPVVFYALIHPRGRRVTLLVAVVLAAWLLRDKWPQLLAAMSGVGR